MVLEWKQKVVCSLQVVGAILPQVEEFILTFFISTEFSDRIEIEMAKKAN